MNPIDTDALLQAISDSQPCGEDMQFSSEFDHILEMRRSDDPTLDQGVWVRDLKVANFAGVRTLCVQLLTERTKDLRLCAWLTEACARTDGFAGMADGLQNTRAVCERFWDGIYPLPDGDDQEERIGNINWLLKQVEDLGATLPLLRAEGQVFGRRVVEAVRASQDSDDERRALAEDVEGAIQKLDGTSLFAHLTAVQQSLEQLMLLQQLLDERLGQEGPSFASAKQSLQDTEHLLRRIAREKGLVDPSNNTAEATEGGSAEQASAGPAPVATPGVLTHRSQALAQLRAVADFFRRTEPHSPVAYLADKAARWGEVPLHQWLRTVVKDPQVLGNLEELLGVEPPPADRDNNSY